MVLAEHRTADRHQLNSESCSCTSILCMNNQLRCEPELYEALSSFCVSSKSCCILNLLLLDLLTASPEIIFILFRSEEHCLQSWSLYDMKMAVEMDALMMLNFIYRQTVFFLQKFTFRETVLEFCDQNKRKQIKNKIKSSNSMRIEQNSTSTFDFCGFVCLICKVQKNKGCMKPDFKSLQGLNPSFADMTAVPN